ncbi:uncharacterized protein LOC128294111 [Gossypium arboreum]|uniref:uncharacterized protein LOC128294111 n=1 Tax=Gossypium arboreum TaxID=29729 RepID=UPI0022F18FC4|nr:uncharacterized protein LOC128294111 [Gossypium arboreum]
MQPLKLRQPVQQEHPEPVPHFPLVMVELPLDLPSKRGSRWRKQQQPQCRQSKSWPPCYPAFPTDPKTGKLKFEARSRKIKSFGLVDFYIQTSVECSEACKG